MSDPAATPHHAIPSITSGWSQLTHLLRKTPPRLNLALQGGGAHGAFTWGVLDALLRQPELTFEGLSGSSAGAMNAVVFADGWMKGGREGAGQALAGFEFAAQDQVAQLDQHGLLQVHEPKCTLKSNFGIPF